MNTRRTHVSFFVAALLLLAVFGAACSDDGGGTTGAPDVELGSGSVPDTVPEDLPIPTAAVVSSTLVDRTNGFTEMIIRLPSDLTASVTYFTQNLPNRGYEISESAALSDARWEMAFGGPTISGTITFRQTGTEVTEAVFAIQEVE